MGLLVLIVVLGSLFLVSELWPVEVPRSWSDVNRSGFPRPAGAGCFAPRRRLSLACRGMRGLGGGVGWWLVRNGPGIGSSVPALAVVGLMAVVGCRSRGWRRSRVVRRVRR